MCSFLVIVRYFDLKEIVLKIHNESDDDLKSMLLSKAQEKELTELRQTLTKMNSCMLALQKPSCTLLQARVIFEKLVKVFLHSIPSLLLFVFTS